MALFQIADFMFINLSRPPSKAMKRTVREVRPGVANVTQWGVGATAQPFALLSSRDAIDTEDAQNILALYEAIVGGDPVALIWAGFNQGLVFVHSVAPLDDGIFATLLGKGGMLGTSNAKIHCQWMLEYVPLGQQTQ
jgi:hypothetical protein